MTTLATHPLADPDQIALFADNWTSLSKPFADKFRDACRAEAEIAGDWSVDGAGPVGYINPNRVRARLIDEPDYNPRQYAALWSSPFLAKTDRTVQIAGAGSRGNTNKSYLWRRWIDRHDA